MSEYGSGLTIGEAATLDKERVRHALEGELVCGETEEGFVYEPASREDCDAYILEVLDNWVYQAKELADSGRAVERVMEANGFSIMNHFGEYMLERAKASREHVDYLYEHDLNALHGEAESTLEGE